MAYFQELNKVIQRNHLRDQDKKALAFVLNASVPNRITLASDQTNLTATMANCLSLTNGIAPGQGSAIRGGAKYHVKAKLICLATTGEGIAVDLAGGTATAATGTRFNYTIKTATTVAVVNTTDFATDASATTVVIAVELDGYLVAASSGSLVLRFSSQNGTTGVVVYAGSWLEVQEVIQ